MVIWSIGLESCKGKQVPLWAQRSWNPEPSGLARSLGRARSHLTPRDQLLANGEAGRYRTCTRMSACSRRSSRAPSFWHGQRQELRWQSNSLRSTRALVAVDMQVDLTFNYSLARDCSPGRHAYQGMEMSAEAVSELCEQGHLRKAVEALGVMVQADWHISRSLLYTVLKKCVAKKDLLLGRRVHALIVEKGYESDTFICNHILRMYVSHARLQEAMDVFVAVDKPDAFTWSAIISAHVKMGQDKQAIELYHKMRRSAVKPDGHVFVPALQACARGADLKSGQQIHADVFTTVVEPDMFVCSCLVDMYAKCGSLEDAQRVFDGLPRKDLVTWSTMIAGYSKQGMGQEALGLYRAMQEDGVTALDSVTFVCLLQACASVGTAALEKGRQLHVQIRGQRLQADAFVASSLVNMYAKCGSLEDARAVFDGLGQKNLVTWSAMIAGYSKHSMGQEALRLSKAMQDEGIIALDSVTYVSLLQACASVGSLALEKGKQLHAQVRDQGLQADVFVANSLVHMYAKCGCLEDAQTVFDGLPRKDVVTWNAMIAGYSQKGIAQEALRLYKAMQQEVIITPNSVTFVCLLQACASVGALHVGRQLHAQIEDQGLHVDVTVGNSLINMYAKAGSMVDAQKVFDELCERDACTWSALISGYTRQGDSEKVFDLILRMANDGMQPNSVTCLCVLTVCSHTGLVGKGREYFDKMSKHYGVTPTVDHYTCMVDLFGRAGELDEALAVARTMPLQPNAAIWHTLLAACQKWGNVEVGRYAFDEAVKLDGKDSAAYVLMSNIYTSAQMWEQALEMQASRRESGAWKQAGQTWWTDMDGMVHTFLVGKRLPGASKTESAIA